DYAQNTVYAKDPVEVARRWVAAGADRIHLVDLNGAKQGTPANAEVISRIAAAVPVPCQLGGGLRTTADVERVFAAGVRWAVLGTKALQDPDWVRSIAEVYPGRIVLGVDARNGFVATDGWLQTSATRALDLVKMVESAPLFAVVYTDIAKDGMMSGPNFEALAELQQSTHLPVIASGGVCEAAHVQELRRRGTFGCIIGRALYEETLTLEQCWAIVRENPTLA
ncbi:MAG: HisA/HisF-related TIM barrel protein, partial [Gemmataceae bacterium]